MTQRTSNRGWSAWTMGVLIVSLVITPLRLAAQTPAEVNASIERGLDFLKSRQRADGSWDELPIYPGGITSVVTLALLSCDVPPESDVIQKALAYLRKIPRKDTYVVALQTMVFAQASPTLDLFLIRENARWLMQVRQPNGVWNYGTEKRGGGDNSNTQFALLGLQAASEAGVDIPPRFWEECRRYWVTTQSTAGSWGYTGRGATGSMTAAGIASLVISSRELHSVRKGSYKGKPVRCDGAVEDKPLEAAVNWMGRNFSESNNPGGDSTWLYYYLYGMERAGRLTGRRFFGDHDWYRAGARYLIRRQSRVDGSWSLGRHDQQQLYNTAFALLFLSKGRIPIVINKLRYGPGDDWNNAPNDVNNLTNFVAQKWRVKLNWQVLDIKAANVGVEDFLQAPILQFSGHEYPQFTAKEKKLLRQYIEQGGLLLVDANCSVGDFDTGFRDLCKELFPEPGQDLRRLEEGHGVWQSLFQLTPNWPLYGIDVGCRTAVFYSPEDLSCQWQHHYDPNSVLALRLGANIVAYATGPENLADKLAERKVYEDKEDEIRRNFLQIAKIRHNGDWNPAPRAIRNLMGSLRNVAKIDVIQQQRDIDILDPNFVNYPLCYMHGRNRFSLNKKEKEVLAEYLRTGGVLFGDACCGNERFDEAFRLLMNELFPDRKLEPIPPEHELFGKDIGYDISTVQFGAALGSRKGPPLLEGISIDGRYVVIYSKYDIGCALERQKSTDCRGYDHESAVRIASNIVLYALKQ